MIFKADVRCESGSTFAGVFACEVTDDGLRFSKRGHERLLVPKGTNTEYLGKSRFSVSLPDQRFRVTVKKFRAFTGRLARDTVEFMQERGPLPQAADYKMPLHLVIPCVLPLGIPVLTLGGALPALIGFGFAGLSLTFVQKEEWSPVRRVVAAWTVTVFAYVAFLALVVAMAAAKSG